MRGRLGGARASSCEEQPRGQQQDAQADARARRQELRATAAAREKARAYRESLERMDIETRVHNSFTVDPDKALMHFWR